MEQEKKHVVDFKHFGIDFRKKNEYFEKRRVFFAKARENPSLLENLEGPDFKSSHHNIGFCTIETPSGDSYHTYCLNNCTYREIKENILDVLYPENKGSSPIDKGQIKIYPEDSAIIIEGIHGEECNDEIALAIAKKVHKENPAIRFALINMNQYIGHNKKHRNHPNSIRAKSSYIESITRLMDTTKVRENDYQKIFTTIALLGCLYDLKDL